MTGFKEGDRVRYWPGGRPGRSGAATVTSDGDVLFGGTDCVRIRKDDGGTDFIALTHVAPLEYQLGDRVKFATHLRRRTKVGEGYYGDVTKHWTSEAYPGQLYHGGEGLIIGKRTLANGLNHYMGDDGIAFIPKERLTAYLVAFDMRRKPVHVLPEDITPL